jgi:sec-independent protein translocase protein TatC
MDEKRMSIIEHLEELRRRILICLVVVGAGAVVSYVFAPQIIDILKKPAGITLGKLKFFKPAEGFMAYLSIALKGGFVLSMPVILYQTWQFVAPALRPDEKRYGAVFVVFSSLLFVIGGLFCYVVLLPPALRYLHNFGSDELEPLISVSSYLSFTTLLIICTGIVFEMPLFVFFLARMGIISPATLIRQWRVAIVAILVIAAVITPTGDPFNLMLLAGPMILLYWISIIVAKFAVRRKV